MLISAKQNNILLNMHKVGDWVILLGKPQKVLQVSKDNTKVFLDTKESPQSDNWWRVDQCELWQPKEGEWVIPNFEKDENSITAYKVKEVISYKNPRTNIVVCYNRTLKLSQVSPLTELIATHFEPKEK